MSATSITQILDRVQHTASESQVLQAIAKVSNVQGRNARISYEAMAARTGFSIRWCMELVARLEQRHLLRVTRTRLGNAHCAINVYDVVVPWRRDLTYQEALERRQQYLKSRRGTAHPSSSERIAHRNPNEREKIPPELPTDAELARIGVYPGSPTYARAKMLDPPPP
jgi:DNA-binding Lrp family transcriptional regulator